jgi:peptidoglycan hydrolase CwlO-like protein
MADLRAIVVSVIGTGIATITVVVGFVAIIANGLNDRIDDTNANVNARISDVNARIGDVYARIDDTNERIDDMNERIDEVLAGIRDLRVLVIDAIGRNEPAGN